MYKRKGCELWTIEECDFDNIERFKGKNNDVFAITNLTWHKDCMLEEQFDVIVEIWGERYLGYILWGEDNLIKNYIFSNNSYKDVVYICYVDFVICQENYLPDVEIVKEIEYRFER